MKQYVKVILPAIFLAVLSVSSLATICMSYSLYDLGVKEGDWVEYDIVEAQNYEFFAEIHSGDKIRFEVVGIKAQERMDPYGTVVFKVEAPVCDVFLNGECIQRNVELGEMLFLPKGEEHWRDLEKIERYGRKRLQSTERSMNQILRLVVIRCLSPIGWRAQLMVAASRPFIKIPGLPWSLRGIGMLGRRGVSIA